MLETTAIVLGYFVMLFGGIGLVLSLAGWALDRVLRVTNSYQVVLRWYADKLRTERKRRRTHSNA